MIVSIVLFFPYKAKSNQVDIGIFSYEYDSNCLLRINSNYYEFYGEGQEYEKMVRLFGKSGTIVKEINLYGIILSLLTEDEDGAAIYIKDNDCIQFSRGIAYNYAYNFYRVSEK
ncbi:MAG: hypothetical protein ACI4U3_00125 [Traorella sp.]